jgi:dihydrofolate reductase
VRKLKAQEGQNIFLDGSSVLAHTLIENDLVDEYALHVYPLVLGRGKRLFPDGKRVNLKLIGSQALPTGVVYQQYLPA